jgi:hypothetical protein
MKVAVSTTTPLAHNTKMLKQKCRWVLCNGPNSICACLDVLKEPTYLLSSCFQNFVFSLAATRWIYPRDKVQPCHRIRWFSIRGISYPRFTAERKKIENYRNKPFISFKTRQAGTGRNLKTHQAGMGHNMVKSSSQNAPSNWRIFLCPRTHASPQNFPQFCF